MLCCAARGCLSGGGWWTMVAAGIWVTALLAQVLVCRAGALRGSGGAALVQQLPECPLTGQPLTARMPAGPRMC